MTAIVVGVTAAILSVTSFIPQAWKIWKTRETEALSRKMCILNTAGFSLWTTYGILERTWPIIVPNAVCLVLAAFILVMKLRSR